MTRIHKLVLWTTARCLFCVLAARILIVPAPGTASAQQPANTRVSNAEGIARPPAPTPVLVPAVDGAHVAYPFKTDDTENDARKLTERYSGRANIHLESRPESLGVSYLHVRAPASVQDEIRAVVQFLSQESSAPGARVLRVYSVRHTLASDAAQVIESQFSGRFRQVGRDDRNSMIFVEADEKTQAEIREVIRGLDRAAPLAPTSDGDRAMMGMAAPQQATQCGYAALAQQQQQAGQGRILIARQALTDAKTDEERDVARAQLRQVLADLFDQDMQMREKQAAEIESRLTKLRQQYDARQNSKDKIIDLQLKVIEQNAAGLGFPGGDSSSSPAPTSPVSDFGSRGLSARNVPATRADQHDPIPKERTLAEIKQTDSAVVVTLKERGHFIESADGKFYAYANVNHPSGPSHIRVIDAATGKLVAAGVVDSVVDSLQFTDEGVVTREADGKRQLRVSMKRRGGPNGEVLEFPSSSVNPFDPTTAALDPEWKKYSTEPQTRVGELFARGHFVGSPDGKLYAYVETSGEGIPEGTAEIRVCDVRTGQRLAAAKIKAPVGKLKFFNEGVATEDADGTLKLRITFSKDHDTQDVLDTTGPAPTNNSGAPLPGGSTPSPASDSAFTAEFNALRNQYRKAKAPLAQAEDQFNALLAEAQKQKPETTIDDLKKQHPTAWQAVERARPDFEAAHRLLETKLEILELDRKSAILALDAAKSKLYELTELQKKNVATLSELNQQRTAADAAVLDVERAERLVRLFQSITAEPTPTADVQSTDTTGSRR